MAVPRKITKALPVQGDTVLPHPDHFQTEAQNDAALNEAWNIIQFVATRMTGPMTIGQIVERAYLVNMINGNALKNPRKLNALGIRNAIKGLIQQKKVMRLDADVLCPYDKIPKLRSLDDSFMAYVAGSERPPEPPTTTNLPSKTDVVASVLQVLSTINLVNSRFHIHGLATAWSKLAPKSYFQNLKAIFAARNGKDAFQQLLRELEKQGYIEGLWATQFYTVTSQLSAKQTTRYRSLDADWE